jgi:hypothetical protein
MGNFYVNYTLRGVTQQAVADALAGRACIVTPPANDTVVVFDEQSDRQDPRVIASLAAELSGKLRCPVLAVLNHDDDILWYQLYTNGELQDEYDSSPGYFDSDAEPSGAAGGDAAKLCSAFGASDTARVEPILRKSAFDDDGYVFAFERHADLVNALGISPFAVGTAYASFESDELPEGLSPEDVIRTA